nr:hypothetical protein [uncultured Carboxylicivirga sp.]
MMIKKILCSALNLLILLQAYSSNIGELTGVIIDAETGDAIPYVSIQLVGILWERPPIVMASFLLFIHT